MLTHSAPRKGFNWSGIGNDSGRRQENRNAHAFRSKEGIQLERNR